MSDDEEIVEVDEIEPTDVDRKRVTTLVNDLKAAEARVDRATRELRAALEAYSNIAERELPEAMKAVGQKSFTTTNDDKVSIRQQYVGSKLTNREGLDWVIANGGANLVRSVIVVEFPVSERETAQRVHAWLRSHPAANHFVKCTLEENVHNATIGAFAREAAEDRKLDVPFEKLGVVRRHKAMLSGRRLTSVDLKGFEKA